MLVGNDPLAILYQERNMNKIYKTFFNSARGCIVVANELSTSKSKSATKTVVASVAMAVAGLACAAAPEYITPPTKLEANEFSFVENSGNTNPYKTITSTNSSELENLWVTGSGAGSKATGYWVDSDGQEATFTNLGNIYVTAVDGANSWSQRAIGAADGATAINKGTIVVQNAYGMTVGSDKNGSTPAKIINEGSIAVYDTGAAMELGGVKGSTAENKGQIYVSKPSTNKEAFTIGVLVKDHEEGTFTNSGLIDAKEATAAIAVQQGTSTDKNTILLSSGSQTLGNILIDAPNTTLNMEDGAVYEGRIFVSKNASKTAISGTQKAEGLTASNGAGAALFLAPADSSASIKNALYSGNKASGATAAMGGAVYSNGSPIYFENTVFDGNSAVITAPAKATDAATGGAIQIKGSPDTVFKDVVFTNNTAAVTGANGIGAYAFGGAINVDYSTGSTTGVKRDSDVKFIITKDLAYTGNTVSSDGTGKPDTYGYTHSHTQAGGFLFLDRGSVATFEVQGAATLTIGEKGTTGDTDSIASSMPNNNKVNGGQHALLNKTGTGTLLVNSDLNKYYGTTDVQEGTMHVTSEWMVQHNVNVTGGTLILDKANIANGANAKNQTNDGQQQIGSFNVTKGELVLTALSGEALDGAVNVSGNDSAFIFGEQDHNSLEAAKAIVGTKSGPNAYIGKTLKLSENGRLMLGNAAAVTAEGVAATPSVVLGEGANLFIAAGSAIVGTENQSFVANEGSSIYLDKARLGQNYQLTEGFGKVDESKANFATTNRLLGATLAKNEDGQLILGVERNDVQLDTIASNTVNAALAAGEGLGVERINALLDINSGLTTEQAASEINRIAMMGTASAAQAMAVNGSNLIADTLDQHGSVLAAYAHEKQGTDLWIDLSGMTSKASRYQAGSTNYGYKSDIGGATLGADYAFGNGTALGGAVSFGKGSARGQGNGSGIKNDIRYWGANVYGVWNTEYANVIGNVGYLQSKNKISHAGYKGKPDVKTFSVGVRVEKPLALNEVLTVTPHVGARYLHVDMESFKAGGFKYTAEKANLFQVPFGVAFNGKANVASVDVKPFVDVQIAPALGDRKVKNKFALATGDASDSIDSRIANNAMYSAKVGVEAAKGAHAFGLNYGIGSGNKGRVDQVLQAKYRYQF